MSPREKVNHLLGELVSTANIGVSSLDENGVCAFTYGEVLEVVFELPETSSTLQIYSPILRIAKNESAALFKRLLRLNLFGVETRGATFALEDKNNFIILCYGVPVEDLDATGFLNLVSGFIETAEKWFFELNQGSLRRGKTRKPFSLSEDLQSRV